MVEAQDEAFARRDRNTLVGLYAPGFVLEDRRPFFAQVFTEEESIGTVRYALDLENIHWARKIPATRGERLALVRDEYTGMDDDVEYELQTLTLVEIDLEGLVVHHTAFEPDSLDLALAELDARAAVLESSPS